MVKKLRSSITHPYILLILTTLLGVFLRVSNLSPFKFYPDAYQSLLVAHNISRFHSVIGLLGPNGMLYPDFLIWTRPLYPLLIMFVSLFTHDLVASAQWISFCAGVIAIPILYFAIYTLFGKRSIGLIGSLLLAMSFNHVVWSGYIMTETTGVLFLLLALALLFFITTHQIRNTKYYILLGIFLALSILTRYEYIVLLLPVTIYFSLTYKKPLHILVTLYISTFALLALVFLLLFPYPFVFAQLTHQLGTLTRNVTILAITLIFSILILKARHTETLIDVYKKLFLGAVVILALIISIQIVFPHFILSYQLTSLRLFFQHDPIIGITFLLGLVFLYTRRAYNPLFILASLSCILLAFIYFQINPTMQRYITHLLPFILPVSSFGLYHIVQVIFSRTTSRALKTVTVLVVVGLSLVQILHTYGGMKQWAAGSWTRISYEEKLAKIVGNKISSSTLIIASFPEPYALFTANSVYSVTNSTPFLYIDNSLNNQTVLTVQDMGMHDIFPKFSTFLTRHMRTRVIGTFWIHEPYHFGTRTLPESNPVVLYRLPLGDLKKAIKNSKL